MSDFTDKTNRIIRELEYEIRADERERLANEFFERGDIGTQPGEMSVIGWLLKSEGGGGQRRRVTRENYTEPRYTGPMCVAERNGTPFTCAKSKNDPIHSVSGHPNFHEFVPATAPRCNMTWHARQQGAPNIHCRELKDHVMHDPNNTSLFAHDFRTD
jgi:hypothetical protein